MGTAVAGVGIAAIVLGALAAVLVIALLWGIATYNALTRARIGAEGAFSGIDVELRRRHDLVPNLVNTVKGYATHERQALEAVIAARAAAVRPNMSMEERVQAEQAAGHRVLMVGDGLNDGPVLAQADVSLAIGSSVPLAQAQADVVLPTARLEAILHLLDQGKRTMRIVRQNLAWAALYNAVGVPLAVMGWLPAWLAGLGMALSSLCVVLNAARLARQQPFDPASELG